MKNTVVPLPFLAAMLSALCLMSACTDREGIIRELDWAEAVMEDNPDSALAFLDTLDRNRLNTRESRARHALLYSQALDKNWIDLTTDSIIRPAVRYYSRHGSPDNRLKTLYYLGRIHDNAGDNESAMRCYVEAEKYAGHATDYLAVGRLYSARRKVYFDNYDMDKSYRDALLSAEYYSKAGDVQMQVKAFLNAAYCAYFLDKRESADSLVHLVREKYWNEMDDLNKDLYFSICIHQIEKTDTTAIKCLLAEYLNTVTVPEYVDWAAVSNSYLRIGNPDSALWALERYPLMEPGYESIAQYQLLNSMVHEALGQYGKAYGALKKYSDIVGREDMAKFNADTRFIEERYANESASLRYRFTILLIISGTVILLLIAAIIIVKMRHKARIARLSAEVERKDAERKQQYLEAFNCRLQEEKAELEKIIADSALDDGARSAVKEMLTTIVRMLTAKASGTDTDVLNFVKHKMEQLAEDRNRFIMAVLVSYTTAHPRFTDYLKKQGLTDWEAGYCCLYAMGLRGKDIGNLLGSGSHAHHNRASAIRAKLGLTEHDMNLGRWLTRLAKETENGTPETSK